MVKHVWTMPHTIYTLKFTITLKSLLVPGNYGLVNGHVFLKHISLETRFIYNNSSYYSKDHVLGSALLEERCSRIHMYCKIENKNQHSFLPTTSLYSPPFLHRYLPTRPTNAFVFYFKP